MGKQGWGGGILPGPYNSSPWILVHPDVAAFVQHAFLGHMPLAHAAFASVFPILPQTGF